MGFRYAVPRANALADLAWRRRTTVSDLMREQADVLLERENAAHFTNDEGSAA